MVERQIAARGIRDPAILDSFRQVPREEFVASGIGRQVYGDHPLPIEAGRLAYLAGRMPKRRYADPSSPLAGII